MIIEVLETSNFDGITGIIAKCGKTTAEVYKMHSEGIINVTVKNNAHRVHRGPGKVFDTIEKAIDGYKSTQVKAIIAHFGESIQ